MDEEDPIIDFGVLGEDSNVRQLGLQVYQIARRILTLDRVRGYTQIMTCIEQSAQTADTSRNPDALAKNLEAAPTPAQDMTCIEQSTQTANTSCTPDSQTKKSEATSTPAKPTTQSKDRSGSSKKSNHSRSSRKRKHRWSAELPTTLSPAARRKLAAQDALFKPASPKVPNIESPKIPASPSPPARKRKAHEALLHVESKGEGSNQGTKPDSKRKKVESDQATSPVAKPKLSPHTPRT